MMLMARGVLNPGIAPVMIPKNTPRIRMAMTFQSARRARPSKIAAASNMNQSPTLWLKKNAFRKRDAQPHIKSQIYEQGSTRGECGYDQPRFNRKEHEQKSHV